MKWGVFSRLKLFVCAHFEFLQLTNSHNHIVPDCPAMKTCRGGAINYQKGSTDIEHLTDLVSSHVKDHGPVNFFDFGGYNSLSSSHAVRGTALARNG